MISNRTSARWMGAFFIISNVVFIVGAAIFLEPILGDSEVLTKVSDNRGQIVLGSLLELSNAFAYLGIAVLVYPILKRRYQSLALGYFGFRVLEFVMQILADLSPLALLTISQAFLNSGAADASAYQAAGEVLMANRQWAFQMISITMGSGALLFYTMLYREKLIPRFISVWGLLGAAVVLGNALFDMFGVTLPNLGYLMLLNELFLGVWLIVKGFNQPAGIEDLA